MCKRKNKCIVADEVEETLEDEGTSMKIKQKNVLDNEAEYGVGHC